MCESNPLPMPSPRTQEIDSCFWSPISPIQSIFVGRQYFTFHAPPELWQIDANKKDGVSKDSPFLNHHFWCHFASFFGECSLCFAMWKQSWDAEISPNSYQWSDFLQTKWSFFGWFLSVAHRLEGAVSWSTLLTFPTSVLYTKQRLRTRQFSAASVTSHNTHQYLHCFGGGNETSQGASNETGDLFGFSSTK